MNKIGNTGHEQWYLSIMKVVMETHALHFLNKKCETTLKFLFCNILTNAYLQDF